MICPHCGSPVSGAPCEKEAFRVVHPFPTLTVRGNGELVRPPREYTTIGQPEPRTLAA